MTNLIRAHNELFRREPDEQFTSLSALIDHCQYQKETSLDRWHLPEQIRPAAPAGQELVSLHVGDERPFLMNDWSFGQLCKLARVKKDTLNRLSADTAKRVFYETLPHGNKPLQVFTTDSSVRSIHAATYTRLYNADVLSVVQEYATDFQPPPRADAGNGGTGLYCGEQDLFAFLIDPTGWVEIDGQAFAPGFFVWNSEVGRRTVGIETFWFQSLCCNHLVWDAVRTVQFSRKHTANVHDALDEIRRSIEKLTAKRDARHDAFVKVVRQAMQTKLGNNADDVARTLVQKGISKSLATEALEIAQENGDFTVFALVDALTRLAGQVQFAGDRMEADHKAASLLALVA